MSDESDKLEQEYRDAEARVTSVRSKLKDGVASDDLEDFIKEAHHAHHRWQRSLKA